jgi:FAD/FMN-containing dehydrogenase
MSGGDLTDSISLVFTKYMNKIGKITEDTAETEPGVYYRDFEKETLAKSNSIMPSYPASRELCALGGMISNNSGGELTLRYGKINQYVRELEVVLADGSHALLHPLNARELAIKEREQTFEGSIYRQIHELVSKNKETIQKAKPDVRKNSAGYALWNVMNEETGTFDLTQLITGSQGTLALVTHAKLGLVKTKSHRAMLVAFLADIEILPEIVKRILSCEPESFESYDDKTFALAVKFMPQMLKQLGLFPAIKLGISFLPDVWAVVRGGIPRLVLMAEFAEDSHEEAIEKARQARHLLEGLHVRTRIAKSEAAAAKYWKVRRESFALLRKNIHGRYAAPFIDDIVVHPHDYPKFLPELYKIVSGHRFIYTIAGHVGDGNFHIIPLVDMNKEEDRAEIFELMPKVYELVGRYKGSITGEHNDGIIRTPYLHYMFDEQMLELFAQVKRIFDPLNILNPGKKVGGTEAEMHRDIIKHI